MVKMVSQVYKGQLDLRVQQDYKDQPVHKELLDQQDLMVRMV
jgi:hypothetical protein